MKLKTFTCLILLSLSVFVTGCIFVPDVNRQYWFEDSIEMFTAVHKVDQKADQDWTNNQFIYSDIYGSLEGIVDANYSIYGVFANFNRFDEDGIISNITFLYDCENLPVVGIAVSYRRIELIERSYDYTYQETESGINLIYDTSIKDTVTKDFTIELIDSLDQEELSSYTYQLSVTLENRSLDFGRVSFIYDPESQRDDAFEQEIIDLIFNNLSFYIRTSPATESTCC